MMHRSLLLPSLWLGLVGCAGQDKSDSGGAPVEPIEVPADPALRGVAVGVDTVTVGELTVELWYPAPESTAGTADTIDFAATLPSSVLERLTDLPPLTVEVEASRGAPLRNTEDALPVLVFSHGFGGTRAQSASLTAHLASRGYVVASVDHSGRSLGGLIPCLFSPPLDGCALSTADSGPDDVRALLDALADGPLGPLSPDRLLLDGVGVFGHSAGGGTTATLAEDDEQVVAAAVLAAPAPIERSLPVLVSDATCDGIIGVEQIEASLDVLADGVRVSLPGAGHLAYSDLCDLDLGAIARDQLAPRDDVNAALLGQLTQLGTDGCDGGAVAVDRPECVDGFLPLSTSTPIVEAVLTEFFDQQLRGEGSGVSARAPAVVTEL